MLNDYVELTIRSEVQKGHGKPEKLDYSYFPESKVLMTAYLKLREEKHPATDALIITEKGQRLLQDGCRDAVQLLCRKLGVKTFKGKLPAPHRFRHSFGTCNINPLGLRLDVYDVMNRLRHTSIELTTRTYISDNPLLAKAKHDVHVKAARESRETRETREIRTVSPLFEKRSQRGAGELTSRRPSAEENGEDTMQDFTVSETQALRLLAPLGINRMALRKYAKGQGRAEKSKGDYYYARTR